MTSLQHSTELESCKFPARIRYSSSYFGCHNPLCLARWMDVASEKILPRRKRLLTLRGNYLYIYSADASEVILAKHLFCSIKSRSHQGRLDIVAESDNSDHQSTFLISCYLRNSNDADECLRTFALDQAHAKKRDTIVSIIKLYMSSTDSKSNMVFHDSTCHLLTTY